MLHRLLMPMEPIAPFAAESAALLSVRRCCQLLEAFERRITITRLPNGQVRGLASLRSVVEPSRKRTVIS